MIDNVESIYPLGPMQETILLQELGAGAAGGYVEQVSWTILGPFAAPAFARAWERAVRRHPALRSVFFWEGLDAPVLVVRRRAELRTDVLDWRGVDPGEREVRLAELREAHRREGFDVSAAPPLRLAQVRTGEAEHRFVWSYHHLVLDGWSATLVLREVLAAYGALCRGEEPPEEPAPSPAGYHAWLRGRSPAEAEAFWRAELAGLDAPARLPAPRGADGADGGAAARVLLLDTELAAGVRAAARRHRVTLQTVLLGAWAVLQARFAGAGDVLLGVLGTGRPAAVPGAGAMVGLFVNAFPVRARVGAGETVGAWLREVQAAHARAREFEHVAPARVRGWSGLPGGGRLFDTLFVLQDFPDAGFEGAVVGDQEVRGFRRHRGDDALGYAALLEAESVGEGLELVLRWDAGLADGALLDGALGHLHAILAAVAAPGDPFVDGLPLLDAAGRARVLELGSAPAAPIPGDTLHRRFAAQAARTPDAVAVTAGGESLTYGELERRSARLAAGLRRGGVRAEARVALWAERSAELVVGILGILRAGGAYVPVDPRQPAARAAHILEDSGCALVLAQDAARALLPAVRAEVLSLEALADGEADEGEDAADVLPGNAAYVIYTSGSTGRPKGVVVTHTSAVRLFDATRPWFGFGGDDVWTLFHSPAFDFSVWEMWGALLHGGRLVVVPFATSRSPDEFHALLRRERVTVLSQTPSAFRQLDAADEARGAAGGLALRCVVFGGEALELRALRGWMERHGDHAPGLVNMYGITETTVHVTFRPIRRADVEAAEGSPIGTAIPDLALRVLDPWGNPVPAAVAGELYVGGAGVARGYLGRPELTAERFVPDAFGGEPGARLYCSGDRVRWLAAGELEYLGRVDHQVKVRGHRVEPGEIEAVLLEGGSLREAVVVAREDAPGDLRLVAYVVPAPGEAMAPAALRERLRDRLPEYMVPAAFVAMERLPLDASGKTDRRALPAPRRDGDAAYEAPRSAVEELLCGIWEEVLGAERVGADQDFFALGGHSLLAMRVVARARQALGVELPVRALFEAPTPAGLAERVEALREQGRAAAPPIVPAPRDGGPLPASFAQQRLWLVDRMEPGSPAYNMPAALRLRGALAVRALGRSLDALAARHETLRTTFAESGGEPVQVIHAPAPVALPVVDVADEAEAARLAREEALRPFDLAAGPLLRCTLLRLAEDDHVLCLTLHHVAGDGWSMDVLVREASALYSAYSRGGEPALPELPVQYADFAVWQRGWLGGGVLDGQVTWWQARLAGAPPVLEVATDRPRAPGQDAAAAEHAFALSPELSAELRALARREGATLFMTALAGWQALLGRWAGQDDVVVGAPVAGRTRAELEGLIGFFVNMLPLRADLAGDPTWREVLGRVREAALGAYAHQEVPFEKLVEALGAGRSLAHTPLFQAAFALERPPGRDGLPSLGDVAAEPFGAGAATARFDLDLTMTEEDGVLGGVLVYRPALFDAGTIARMARALEAALAALAADPERRLSRLSLLDDAERAQVLRESRGAPAAYPAVPVHRLVAAQAARTPDAPAVVHGGRSLSYAGLQREAARVAAALRGRGIGPGARVAVCLERSAELAVALLGTLRAGAAFVPLDPAYPRGHLARLLAGSGARAVLTAAGPAGALPAEGPERILVDVDVAPGAGGDVDAGADLDPDHLAYVIYTSGSTGTPKGVMLSHRSLACYADAMREHLALGPSDRVLQFASPAFDVMVEEVFPALLAGACVVFPEGGLLGSLGELHRVLREERISVVELPTAFWHEWVRSLAEEGAALPADLRLVLVGGERVIPGRQAEWARLSVPLLHVFGLTETAVTSATLRLEPGDDGSRWANLPVGRALPNVRLYVLDGERGAVPAGVAGELYVGGDGVARGYLDRPGLTAERFVPDPFAGEPGARLYRTGDRVRRLSDGNLEFLGRIDQQAKVRGFRIEPAEVEAVLAEHPAVREAAVVVREDAPGRKQLVGYVVAAPGTPLDELRRHLRERLPEHMVPSALVPLDALPLTPNGKTDRRALPAPEPGSGDAEHVEPRTATEELLAGIWAAVLGTGRVGVRDGFFALGGHSLLAMRVVSRVRRDLGVELPLRAVFEAPTVEALAARVDDLRRAGTAAAPPLVRVPREGPVRASFAQQRLWLVDRMEPGSPAYNMPFALRLRGPLDVPALGRSLDALAARHETLRTVFAERGGEPVQVIHAPAPVPLPVVDVADDAEAARLAAEEALRPFDLAAGPLLRCALLRLAPDDHVALFTLHHVVSDGWSMDVLVREVSALYGALSRGEEPALPELPVQYADFAAWQRAWLAGDVLEAQAEWWRERLAGAPPLLEVPTDRPRAPGQGGAAGRVPLALSPQLTRELRALARREGATLFMTVLAGWQALLGRYAGQDDVVVGTPVAGRTRAELEGLIGFFVNMLALRADLSGDPSWAGLLARVREAALGAYAHQELPFERLVEEVAAERSPTHAPIFQAGFSLERALPGGGGLSLGRVAAEPFGGFAGVARTDLDLAMLDDGEALGGELAYRAALWEAGSAARMAGHLELLLEAMAADPSRRVAEVPLLRGAERAQVLDAWQGARAAFPRVLVHRLVVEQALRTPDAAAVVEGGRVLRYADLDRESGRVARALRARGVGPETRVAVCLERSAGLVVALLGVLRAGGAYVPLDPGYPRERLALLLADSGARVVLTRGGLAGALPADGPERVLIDKLDAVGGAEAPDGGVDVDPDQLAYLVYTSGSTGTPRGVMVSHASLAHLVAWHVAAFGVTGADRAPLVASPGFDVSVMETWPYLVRGASLHPVPEEARLRPEALRGFVLERGITVATLTTAPAEALMALEWPREAPLRLLLCGGEALKARPRPGLPFALVNCYGPTEGTVDTAVGEVSPAGDAPPSLGRPIARVRAYVLGAGMQPVPAGVAGELYIGGAGVARGYAGRPAETAERFVPDPFGGEAGARLYRSGDRVRWLAGGELAFLGRTDQQVKVRGFRVELGEVEAALLAHPSVGAAAAAVREDGAGEKRLVGYVVAGEAEAAGPAVRAWLRERVPEHLVPSAVMVLERLPLTANGKVDRRALPAPRWDGGAEYVAPRTPAEEVLGGIWADVLGRERVGAEEDFFDAGGHSLVAARVVARVREAFRVELPLRAVFEAPTLAELAARIEALARDGSPYAVPPVGRVPRDGRPHPASYGQRRLWLVDRMEPGSAAYNMPVALRLRGTLCVRALRASLDAMLRRHEALRTTLREEGGEPVQTVHAAAPVPLPVVEVADVAEAARLAVEEAARPFDLAAGPLLRCTLLRLAPEDHVVLLTVHHVASDGWSMGVLVREISALYAALSRGEEPALPELPVQYADFAAWQRVWLADGTMDAQVGWWRERLAGAPPLLEVPTDRRRAAGLPAGGGVHRFSLSSGVSDDLRTLARREGATLFMAVLAGWQALLGRWSGQDDVVVGTPVAGRTRTELEGLIGFFVNMLALRTELSGDPGWAGLLARVREAALEAYAHQEVPFERLVEELVAERSPTHAPLFQVTFALERALGAGELSPGGVAMEAFGSGAPAAKFDLDLTVHDDGGALRAEIGYRTALFDPATIAGIARHLETMLEAMAAGPDGRVWGVPLLRGAERARVLEDWNDTAADLPPACVHELFADGARRAPDAVALDSGGESLTYAEVERGANRLARLLRERGVGPETRVGVCMERGAPAVVALLAVLKAGGAYVPQDPGNPPERLREVFADAGVALVLTHAAAGARLPAGLEALRLDEPETAAAVAAMPADAPALPADPEQLAYVVYTSGSTGRPKGVAVSHRAVVRLVRGADYLPFGPEERIAQVSTLAFDAATFEIWGALLNGGSLAVIERDATLSPAAFGAALRERRITAAFVTTALFNRVAHDEPDAFAPLRHVLFGGEAADPGSVRRVLEAGGPGRLLHVYGPTETTTFASWHPVHGVGPGAATVPIGGPLANTTLYVLDARGEPAPPGLPGELFVGGAGVARGYLGRPDLTAERFGPDAFGAAGGRLYRTGDRVRWNARGELEYLGRLDQQVKVRGFRIEPGEVEAALLLHERVREALVLAREDEPGERRLMAYVVAAGGADVAAPELRAHLRARLPEHMVPAAYVVLERLPLTANGKLDRRALPAPERDGAGAAYVPPRTAAEEVLAGIWAETLRLETVGAEDDFFGLGGHSLLAAQVVSRVRAALGVELPLRAVFEAPTVAALARRVEALRGADAPAAPPIVPVPRDPLRPPPASFAQRRLWFIQQMEPESVAYNMPSVLRLQGPLDPRAMAGALADLAARHETLRTVFAVVDGEPVQVVRSPGPRPVPVVDLRRLPADARAAEVRRLARAEAGLPFDLARGPLLRAGLLRADETEWVLLLTLHHVVGDGWSTGILLRETLALYEARRSGADAALPPLPVQYADFAVWQRAWLSGEVLDRQLAFWRARLAGAPPVLELPTDRPRPAVQGSREGHRPLVLAADTSRALRALSRREGATLFMTLLGAWQLLLARYAGVDDVSVGSPVAGRTRLETEGLIGFFVNMLVLRTGLPAEGSFAELLRQVRETTLGAYAHQEVPFEKLVEELAPERSLTHTPLFQVMFALQRRERAAPPAGSLGVEEVGEEGSAAKYDLTLELAEGGDGLAGAISYREELFDAATVQRMAEHLATLAAGIAADPDRPLTSIPMLGEAERARLVEEWNATDRPFRGDLCIHQAFEAQAARTPEAIALVFRGEEVSYAELDRRAERVARALRRRGVGPEDRVGVCVERSAGTVAALLGVLKAGGAYVPLDPSYPRERLAYVVRDSGLAVAVAGERQRGLLPEGVAVVGVDGEGSTEYEVRSTLRTVGQPDGGPSSEDEVFSRTSCSVLRTSSPGNLAYVIYTSGSTGAPKGVGVTHRNALGFFAAMDERVGVEAGTWMAVTSIGFDISVLELLWTLSRGFRVVVHPGSALAPAAAARRSTRPVDFSLFYFASAAGASDGYRLLLEGAKFADRNGFAAVWTPERHFHDFGGLYPNPSVTGAAVAAVTERVGIRAGSVVLPLHSPVRVAEEWAVVDVLSRGRVGISFASGWHSDDFVLAPASYAERREVMLRGIEEVRSLWRGEALRMVGGAGDEVEVRTLPRPVQAELPVWITSAGSPESFEAAGERGYNVLTHLLGQSVEELAAKVALYRDALRRHGRDPDSGRVALMLHAFVGESEQAVRETVREPFKRYLASSVGLIRGLARSMGVAELDALAPDDMDALLEHAFERYFGSAGLMGTAEQCLAAVERLRDAGVDELACLVDFGVETDAALAALERLDEVRRRAADPAPEAVDDAPLAAEILRHGATHLQCTPSALRTMLPDADAPRALSGLRKLLLGGEALPGPLAADALATGVGELHNMYGPTETTVWSATHRVESAEGGIPVGTPVANTRIHLVDRAMELVPVGVRGELLIGGEGVARGYLGRPGLTAERFVPDPFGREPGARLYRTGDLARRRADGLLELVGRADRQVKVRGHRVEPGEVEAALEAHPGVAEAAVTAREDAPGEHRLVAYLAAPPGTAVPSPAELRGWLRERLPEYLVPSAFVALDRLPRTPGGKLDRLSLPAPDAAPRGGERAFAPPRTPVEAALARAWAQVLRVERVGVHDNFFESGGDSILAIQVVARAAREGVRVTPRQLFQHQTVAELAAVAGTAAATSAEQGAVVGSVPPTPIQRWLLDQDLPDPHHYNQAVLLAPREALDAGLLARAVAGLETHHDALRLRFTPGAEGWSQEIGPPGGRAPFTVLDLGGVRAEERAARIEQAAAALQAGLDLARGPVFRAGLMECGAGEPQRLVLVVHHLAVDGVSWRVLLEDLESACRQLREGGSVRLPPKTTSFREWAERLAGYARSEALAAELPYWTDARRLDVARVPVDRAGPNPESGMRAVTVRFTAEETRALLHEAPAAYRARVDDFLLAALARALAAWTGGRRVLVGLEGHGREELFPGVDLSRTVGWLTSLVPVLLETGSADGPADALKSVKEQLRAMPNRGVGHGVLRWLHPDPAVRDRLAAAPAPEVLFNYLGQLDGAVGGDALFRPAPESRGPDRGPRGERGHLVEVTGMVFGGELHVDWLYGREVHDRATVERVAERFAAELRSLVAHCREPGAGGVTPSDFPLAGLTQEELDARLGSGAGVEDVYPVTPMQEGLLFESLYSPGTGLYVGQLVAELGGELDPEVLERAWEGAAARHEVLRAAFLWQGVRRPLQVVRRDARVPFRREDLRELGSEDREARLARYLEEDRREGFDPARAPLTRVALFRTGGREHRMVWTHHHLILDGWSLPVLLRDVLDLYSALLRGAPAGAGAARPYRDFVTWLAARDLARAEDFWRSALAGIGAPTPLPGGRPAVRGAAAGHAEVKRELPAALTRALGEQARRLGVTPGTVVQGAWALLLSRHVGEEEVVFGTTVAGRPAELEGVEEMVGLFINTLPVRVRAEGEATLREWLRRLQAEQAEAREHEHAPLAEVQRWSGIPAGEPLFESLVAFENYPVGTGEGGGTDLGVTVSRSIQENGFPLVLTAVPGERLGLELRHDLGRVPAETGRQLMRHLETLLEGMAGDAGTRLAQLSLLRADERARVLEGGRGGARPFAREALAHDLVVARAAAAPDRPAIACGDRTLTFGELDAASARLAARLRAAGAGPDTPVAIFLDRSAELGVALLAVLRAGGAFLPLDVAYPRERLEYLLEDSGARVVVTRSDLAGRLPAGAAAVLCVDDGAPDPVDVPPAPRVGSEALAYLIYTSGSTGRPKAVMVSHRSLVCFIDGIRGRIGYTPDDRVLQFASPAFDVLIEEVFPPWASGACVVFPEGEAPGSPRELVRVLEDQRVTIAELPTAFWHEWVRQTVEDGDRLPATLRLVAMGSERVLPERLAQWATLGRPLLHGYGLTETTVATTTVMLPAGEDGSRWPSVPIGVPLPNAEAHVLDAGGEPVPEGVPGELYLGGEVLARGYRGHPALTAARWVPHPFSDAPGARLCRTGDRVRRLPDGNLEFLGRVDAQVKIRGFRIEPGEVEAVLGSHPAVGEAAVVVREDARGEKVLVGYASAAAGERIAAQELRAWLRERLPEHMVPAAFVALERLPLTPNGKVDRRALPAPRWAAAAEYVAPRTATEEILAGTWAETLRLERVGAEESFFALGGHSLLAMEVVSRVRRALGVELPLRTVFAEPTVAALARRVDALRRAGAPAAPALERVPRGGALPASLAQRRLWLMDPLGPGSPARSLSSARRMRGALDPAVLRAALGALVERHEPLRTTLGEGGGEPVQVVHPASRAALPVVELSGLAHAAREREAERVVGSLSTRPLDPAGPPFRALLARLGAEDHVLCLALHPAAGDAWSLGVLERDLSALYAAFSGGESLPLSELPFRYGDYAAWQRGWLTGETLEERVGWWRERLGGAPPLLEIPTDRARAEGLSEKAGTHAFTLPPATSRGLRALSRREGATLFMTVLAGWQALLARWAGTDDVVVGTRVSGRTQPGVEGLVGPFANLLALRGDLSGDPTWTELLGRTRAAVLGALDHQELPFEMLVEALDVGRSPMHAPVFQAGFALERPGTEPAPGSPELEPFGSGARAAELDLELAVVDRPESLEATLVYRRALFDAETVARMAGHLETLLEAMVADPRRRLSEVPACGATREGRS